MDRGGDRMREVKGVERRMGERNVKEDKIFFAARFLGEEIRKRRGDGKLPGELRPVRRSW